MQNRYNENISPADEKKMDKICDVLVIGGGINGCGIAQEAQTRGLNVILCEQNDLAEGTSSASSKLIHGGLRYLEQYEFGLVRKALKERETLFQICPNLIQPLGFVLPYSQRLRSFWFLRLGLYFYDHLARTSLPKTTTLYRKPNHRFLSPLRHSFKKGFYYYDALGDDSRLVISNALQAKEYGADILTRTQLLSTKRLASEWLSTVRDHRHEYQIKSKILINAAGPWVETLNQQLGINTPYTMSLIKGCHLVCSKLYEGDHAYILQHSDNRIVFTIPYQQHYTLIGTTESTYKGPLGKINVTFDEKMYLIEVINTYFMKSFNEKNILDCFAGVRPLVKDRAEAISDISRDYVIHLDENAAPSISIFSGKLTTYRKLAEETVSQLKTYFPSLKPSISHKTPLPGGDMGSFKEFINTQQRQYPWLPQSLLYRYASQYGTRMDRFLEKCDSITSLGSHFGADLYQKEVTYLKNHEWAQTADDILRRRTKLSLKLNNKEIIQLEKELSNAY